MARKSAAAVSLGKRRMEQLSDAERTELGKAGARARLSKLTPAQRSEIARKAGKVGGKIGGRGRAKKRAP
jgi:hypothetical protein